MAKKSKSPVTHDRGVEKLLTLYTKLEVAHTLVRILSMTPTQIGEASQQPGFEDLSVLERIFLDSIYDAFEKRDMGFIIGMLQMLYGDGKAKPWAQELDSLLLTSGAQTVEDQIANLKKAIGVLEDMRKNGVSFGKPTQIGQGDDASMENPPGADE